MDSIQFTVPRMLKNDKTWYSKPEISPSFPPTLQKSSVPCDLHIVAPVAAQNTIISSIIRWRTPPSVLTRCSNSIRRVLSHCANLRYVSFKPQLKHLMWHTCFNVMADIYKETGLKQQLPAPGCIGNTWNNILWARVAGLVCTSCLGPSTQCGNECF